jgi:hypothetical protein
MSIPVRITATVAIARAGSSGGSHDGGADIGMGLHGRAYLINFIDCQFTSARPCEDPVVVLFEHYFFSYL